MRLQAVLLISALALIGCGQSKIEHSCLMNGHGVGSCSFTNTGKAAGSECGKVQVLNHRTIKLDGAKSSTFCSGRVEPSSTTKVEFSIPSVSSVCASDTEDWTKTCTFFFLIDK